MADDKENAYICTNGMISGHIASSDAPGHVVTLPGLQNFHIIRGSLPSQQPMRIPLKVSGQIQVGNESVTQWQHGTKHELEKKHVVSPGDTASHRSLVFTNPVASSTPVLNTRMINPGPQNSLRESSPQMKGVLQNQPNCITLLQLCNSPILLSQPSYDDVLSCASSATISSKTPQSFSVLPHTSSGLASHEAEGRAIAAELHSDMQSPMDQTNDSGMGSSIVSLKQGTSVMEQDDSNQMLLHLESDSRLHGMGDKDGNTQGEDNVMNRSLTGIQWLNSFSFEKTPQSSPSQHINRPTSTTLRRSRSGCKSDCENRFRAARPEDKEKPSHTYKELIEMALRSARNNSMRFKEIKAWLMKEFNYFKIHENCDFWKNGVRHSLSSNDCFVRDTVKKGVWTLDLGSSVQPTTLTAVASNPSIPTVIWRVPVQQGAIVGEPMIMNPVGQPVVLNRALSAAPSIPVSPTPPRQGKTRTDLIPILPRLPYSVNMPPVLNQQPILLRLPSVVPANQATASPVATLASVTGAKAVQASRQAGKKKGGRVVSRQKLAPSKEARNPKIGKNSNEENMLLQAVIQSGLGPVLESMETGEKRCSLVSVNNSTVPSTEEIHCNSSLRRASSTTSIAQKQQKVSQPSIKTNFLQNMNLSIMNKIGISLVDDTRDLNFQCEKVTQDQVPDNFLSLAESPQLFRHASPTSKQAMESPDSEKSLCLDTSTPVGKSKISMQPTVSPIHRQHPSEQPVTSENTVPWEDVRALLSQKNMMQDAAMYTDDKKNVSLLMTPPSDGPSWSENSFADTSPDHGLEAPKFSVPDLPEELASVTNGQDTKNLEAGLSTWGFGLQQGSSPVPNGSPRSNTVNHHTEETAPYCVQLANNVWFCEPSQSVRADHFQMFQFEQNTSASVSHLGVPTHEDMYSQGPEYGVESFPDSDSKPVRKTESSSPNCSRNLLSAFIKSDEMS